MEIDKVNTPQDVVAYLIDKGNAEIVNGSFDEPWQMIIETLRGTAEGERGRIFEQVVDGLDGQADVIRSTVYAAMRRRFAKKRGGLNAVNPALTDKKEAVDAGALREAMRKREMGDAELFATLFTGQTMHDHSETLWYLWSGQSWEPDRVRAIVPLASTQLTEQYVQALNVCQMAGDEEGAKRYAKRIEYLCSRRYLDNVLTLAATLPTLRITGDEWDADPWMFGVENGVIDLHDASFRPGRPGDMLRKMSPVEWCGLNEPAPRWEQFLLEIFAGDQEIVDFVRRLLGYGITGLSTEHVFPVLWGPGRNGKSTLLETLAAVLGDDMACSIPSDALMMSRSYNNAPQPFIYAMRGKRIVWANETNPNRKLDAGMVKQLTGGDSISVRTLHARPVQFKPSHLLLLLTNSKPGAPSDDLAIWDRVALIPFEVRFVVNPDPSNPLECRRDTNLRETMLTEASGILAWLVRGCLEWQAQGLDMPDKVKLATSTYRDEEDTFKAYVEEELEVGDGQAFKVQCGTAYPRYTKWCKANGFYPLKSRRFREMMAKRFFIDKKNDGNYFVGVRYRNDLQMSAF